MSGAEEKPGIHSAFAEALRRKRGGQKTSTAVDLEAMEAALEAEIEVFSQSIMPALDGDTATSPRKAASPKPDSQVFPQIVPEGIAKAPRAPSPAAAAPRPGPAVSAAAPAAPRASLLDQLRQQAEARQNDDGARQRERAAHAQRMDAALRRLFSYCHELVQQLNFLHPPIERQYAMLGNVAFAGLEWKQGFTDYRTYLDGGQTLYESVSLSCKLEKAETQRIEKDGISADNFRKALFDQGVVFTCEEIRNARQMVEKVVFSISAEVRVNLRCRADLDRGILVLETRNLERFGSVAYFLSPEAVDSAMLDEFARLLLGQPSRFRDYCSTLCPPAQSR